MRRAILFLIISFFAIVESVNGQSIVTIQGRLIDKFNNPLQATISIGSFLNTTDSNGNYFLQVPQGVYDVNYNLQNLWIKLLSLNLDSDRKNMVSLITNYGSNKVSFDIDIPSEQTLQVYSPNKPNKIMINGTLVGAVDSLAQLETNTWYYDSSGKKLSIRAIPDSSLVGYWKFDEGSGATAYDSSPFKNNGNLVNIGNCASASEGSTITVSCPSGGIISSIDNAVYVNGGSPASCSNPNPAGFCSRYCDYVNNCIGQSSCSFTASNANCGGDPCTNSAKKLILKVSCSNSGWVTGKYGKALSFDGVNDYVDMGNPSSLNFLSTAHAITVEAWVYPTQYTGHASGQYYIASKLNYPNSGWFLVLRDSGHISFSTFDGTEHGAWYSTTIPLNQWSHVVGWSDGTTDKVFINGVEQASGASGTLTDASSTDLALSSGGSDYTFNGTIDEVKIFNRALTADEIKREYNVSSCSDGTAYGQCSSVEADKPKWCNSTGYLIPNQCGASYHNCPCQTDQSCNETTGSCYTPTSCDSTCKLQGFSSGTCEVGSTTNSKNLAVQPFSADAFNSGRWTSAIINPLGNFVFLDYTVFHYLSPAVRIEPNDASPGSDPGNFGAIWTGDTLHCSSNQHALYRMWVKIEPGGQSVGANIRAGCDFFDASGYMFTEGLIPFSGTWQDFSGSTSDWVFLSISYPDLHTYPASIGKAVDHFDVWIQNAPRRIDGNTFRAWVDDVELYCLNPGENPPPAIGPPTGTCQSGESLIGQDSCSSGVCCCSGNAQTCSPLSYPSDRWQRVWYTHSTGACLGNGPDQTSATFDDNWVAGVVAYNQADDIQFNSSRTINLPAATYTFTLGSDDGARLWIDDVLQIDKWVDRGYTTDSVTLSMTAGDHRFRIDYYENTGNAEVSFSYSQTVTPSGWKVFQNSTSNYLQNKTGQVIFSSSDAKAVINAAIANAVSGDTIYIEPGTYVMTGSISSQSKNGITLTLVSGAILKAPASFSNAIILLDGVNNWIIQGDPSVKYAGEIDGNGFNQGSSEGKPLGFGVGIEMINCVNIVVQNLYIHHCRVFCVESTYASSGIKVLNNHIYYGLQNGIQIGQEWAGDTTNSLVQGNWVEYSCDVGISTMGSNTQILNNTLDHMDLTGYGWNNGLGNGDGSHWGIGMEGVYAINDLIQGNTISNSNMGIAKGESSTTNTYERIIGNTIHDSTTFCIVIQSGNYNTISNNIMSGPYIGVALDSSYNTGTGNTYDSLPTHVYSDPGTTGNSVNG